MINSLHRKLWVVLVALVVVPMLQAQYTGQAKSSRMRAVGILTVDPKGKARLFPVAIYTEGKYYDANMYEAKRRQKSMSEPLPVEDLEMLA